MHFKKRPSPTYQGGFAVEKLGPGMVDIATRLINYVDFVTGS